MRGRRIAPRDRRLCSRKFPEAECKCKASTTNSYREPFTLPQHPDCCKLGQHIDRFSIFLKPVSRMFATFSQLAFQQSNSQAIPQPLAALEKPEDKVPSNQSTPRHHQKKNNQPACLQSTCHVLRDGNKRTPTSPIPSLLAQWFRFAMNRIPRVCTYSPLSSGQRRRSLSHICTA
jgi:hypothetical protein